MGRMPKLFPAMFLLLYFGPFLPVHADVDPAVLDQARNHTENPLNLIHRELENVPQNIFPCPPCPTIGTDDKEDYSITEIFMYYIGVYVCSHAFILILAYICGFCYGFFTAMMEEWNRTQMTPPKITICTEPEDSFCTYSASTR